MKILSESVYEAQIFIEADLSGTLLEKSEFITCEFQLCNFSESSLQSCIFRECSFLKSNLDLMKVDRSVFKNTQFKDCRLMGVNWTRASWGKRALAQLVKTINFQDSILNYSIFMGLSLNKVKFTGCALIEADFSETDLRKADFSDCDLDRAIFRNSDLREVDFSKARNYVISPQLNNISKAKFSLPEAMSLLYSMDIDLID